MKQLEGCPEWYVEMKRKEACEALQRFNEAMSQSSSPWVRALDGWANRNDDQMAGRLPPKPSGGEG